MYNILLSILLSTGFHYPGLQPVSPDTGDIEYHSVYTAGSDLCEESVLRLNIGRSGIKTRCSIFSPAGKITGYLVKNMQKVNRNRDGLYNFYLTGNKVTMLLVRFYKEDGKHKAMILNQDYAKIFKPCFDLKGIEMTLNLK